MASITRMFKRADPEIYVSKEAKELLLKAIEDEGIRLGRMATRLANEDGRKTVLGKDIMGWKPVDEMEDDDFIFKDGRYLYYNKIDNISRWNKTDNIKALPVKFLKNKLMFRNTLYEAHSIDEAKMIMESYEQEMLDSLMEPHWAYNIYEFRDWDPVEELGNETYKLSMWFDDYDGGDYWFEGVYFG